MIKNGDKKYIYKNRKIKEKQSKSKRGISQRFQNPPFLLLSTFFPLFSFLGPLAIAFVCKFQAWQKDWQRWLSILMISRLVRQSDDTDGQIDRRRGAARVRFIPSIKLQDMWSVDPLSIQLVPSSMKLPLCFKPPTLGLMATRWKM